MTETRRGRPRAYARPAVVLEAARLFWRYGYSGTSTRALAEATGLSSSSLYAAFGSKAGLFGEAVDTYAARYHAIFEQAVAEPRLGDAVDRLFTASVEEFTQDPAGHPGCLVGSAVMTDSPEVFDAVDHIARLRERDRLLLVERLERAAAEGEVPPGVDAEQVASLLLVLWDGLSVHATRGVRREQLLAMVHLARAVLAGHLEG